MKVCQLKITKFVSGKGSTTWVVQKTRNHSGWLWWLPFFYFLQEWHGCHCPHPTSNTPTRYWSNDPITYKMTPPLPSLNALSQVNNVVRRQSQRLVPGYICFTLSCKRLVCYTTEAYLFSHQIWFGNHIRTQQLDSMWIIDSLFRLTDNLIEHDNQ